MSLKAPIFHPYTTNTGQVLLSDLVMYPRSSIVFQMGPDATGIPVAPQQITTEDPGEGLVLMVYPEMHIVAAGSVPPVFLDGTPQIGTIALAEYQWHLLQWTSQYFTPIPLLPLTEAKLVIIDILYPQNSSGDTYKLENR